MNSSPMERSLSSGSEGIQAPSFSPISSPDSISCIEYSSDSSIHGSSDTSIPVTTSIPTFKLVGDNIDKNVKPRHETSQQHTKSLHYFHSYAVRDRTDVASLDDNHGIPVISSIDVNVVLPTTDDKANLIENMVILAGWVIRKHCCFFKKHVKRVEPHIKHTYSKEMAQKSEVVCGIELHCV